MHDNYHDYSDNYLDVYSDNYLDYYSDNYIDDYCYDYREACTLNLICHRILAIAQFSAGTDFL